jgi:hypothetical protein
MDFIQTLKLIQKNFDDFSKSPEFFTFVQANLEICNNLNSSLQANKIDNTSYIITLGKQYQKYNGSSTRQNQQPIVPNQQQRMPPQQYQQQRMPLQQYQQQSMPSQQDQQHRMPSQPENKPTAKENQFLQKLYEVIKKNVMYNKTSIPIHKIKNFSNFDLTDTMNILQKWAPPIGYTMDSSKIYSNNFKDILPKLKNQCGGVSKMEHGKTSCEYCGAKLNKESLICPLCNQEN